MARPAENLAIQNRIIIGVPIFMMCFPCPFTKSPPTTPYESLLTLFTFATRRPKTDSDIAIRKGHFTPPWSVRDYIVALIWRMSSRILSVEKGTIIAILKGRMRPKKFYLLTCTVYQAKLFHTPKFKYFLELSVTH